MYLTVDLKKPEDHKHKLAPVVEGLFKVMNADIFAVIIEKADQSIETASGSPVDLAPSRCLERKSKRRLQQMKLHSDKASERSNMTEIVTGSYDDADPDKVQCDTSIANPIQTSLGLETTTINRNGATFETGVRRRRNTKKKEKNTATKEHTSTGPLTTRPTKIGEADMPSTVSYCLGSGVTAADLTKIHGNR